MKATILVALAAIPACLAAGQCEKKPKPSSSSALVGISSSASQITSISNPAPSASAIGGNLNANNTRTLPLDARLIDHLHWPGPTSPEVSTDSGLKINAEVYLVDLDGTTEEQIAKYKADGKIVLCYFSAGGWDTVRVDSNDYDPACVCGGTFTESGCSTTDNKQNGWDAWWIDIHSAECRASAENIMTARFKRAAEKGFDGVNLDNVDGYLEGSGQTHGNTIEDQVSYMQFLSKTAKDHGLLVGFNNGGAMLAEHKDLIVDGFDYVIVESCRQWDECDVYDPFLDAGKPTYQFEYDTSIATCPSAKEGQHLTVYEGLMLDTAKIVLSC